MISLVKFNFYRIFTSKLFIISTLITILINIIFWTVWANLSIMKVDSLAIVFHWGTICLWVLYISLINISMISNVMISDIENGIYSLEIRKGINYKSSLWLKLIVIKILIWSVLCIAILLFLSIVYMANPINKEIFTKGYIPGYAALFGFDFLFTGIALLLGAFLNTKLFTSATTFFALIFALSPILGIVHLSIFYKDDIKISYSNTSSLNLQQIAKENPDGIVKFLIDELTYYSEDNEIFTITEKQGSTSNNQDVWSFEQIQKNTDDLKKLSLYYLSFAQPFDFANFFNANEIIGTNAQFELTDSYKKSSIYNFFELTKSNSKDFNYLDSAFKSIGKQNFTGKNQLNDYINFISSTEIVNKLEQTFNLKNVKNDLKKIESILKQFYSFETNSVNSPFITKKMSSNSPNELWDFNFNYIADKFSSNYDKLVVDFITEYEKLQIHDGNQLYFMILLQLIAAASQNTPNTGAYEDKNSLYSLIKNKDKKIYQVYLSNPLMSFPYMSLLSGTTNEEIINNQLIDILHPSLYAQDLILNENDKFIKKVPFTNYENLPISSFSYTKKVLNTAYFYLVYILIGILFGLISYFIYIKRIRP